MRLPESAAPVSIATFPPLAHGQEAVTGYLRYDPLSGDFLVSLLSGSPLGETGGDGTGYTHRISFLPRHECMQLAGGYL